MGKKIIFFIIFMVLISCKRNNNFNAEVKRYDTVFVETPMRIDTLLLNVSNNNANIWLNKIVYKKQETLKKFILASSLTHQKYIALTNINNKVIVDIIGENPSFKFYNLKRHTFIVTVDSLYNYGKMEKVIYSFLIDKKTLDIHKNMFSLTSSDDGKSYDKHIEFIKDKDTMYLKIKK